MEIRRRADVDDLRAAREAHNRALRVGFRGILSPEAIDAALRPTDDESLEALAAELTDERGTFQVAEREGAIVGFVRARYAGTADYVDPLGGEIVDLAVDPARWRQGVGSALVETAVEWFPDMIDGAWIAVLAEDERARAFLEEHGFEHEEAIEAAFGGTALRQAAYRRPISD
jgi:ribosomal protein S18 acetylase RimI-like enzyme